MPYRVIDVVLHTTNSIDMFADPPLDKEVDLGHGVRVAPIDKKVSREVIELCNPHRLRRAPTRLFVARYGFVRGQVLPDDANPFAFDSDGRLNAALAMSRLIHPTSIGFEESARLILDDDDNITEALPGHIKGAAAYAYVAGVNPRNWLTKAEAVELAHLFDAFIAGEATLPRRVARAVWRLEYAARSKYLDWRWLFVVSGLEALLKMKYPLTGRGPRYPGSTKQFVARTVGLASRYAVRGLTWTDTDARDAYEQRSDVAHGHPLNEASPQLDLYVKMEMLLRYTLVEALTSATFATKFDTDAAIEAAWPT